MQKLYKIRDSKTGLYSLGGSRVAWNDHGKSWSTIGKVKCSLTNWLHYNQKKFIPQSWEIVEFMVNEINVWNAEDLYIEKA